MSSGFLEISNVKGLQSDQLADLKRKADQNGLKESSLGGDGVLAKEGCDRPLILEGDAAALTKFEEVIRVDFSELSFTQRNHYVRKV